MERIMPSKKTELAKNLRIEDISLVYKDILIMGDLQLGYEESMEYAGYLIPHFQLKDIIEKLDKIFSKVKIKRVIINGDLKHEFGTILNQEWRDTLKMFDYLFSKVGEGGEVIVVRGNHDVILDPITRKRNVKIVDEYIMDDIAIVHGHKLTTTDKPIIIIGHEHPAISFKERREEKYKCFLVGKWKGKKLIVQPSCNPLIPGSDIFREEYLSPFLKEGIEDFEVYVIEDGIKYFGKVKDIRDL